MCVVFCASSVDNHTMESHSAVSIRILDVNDNPPELATPYEASICEDAEPGKVSSSSVQLSQGLYVTICGNLCVLIPF